MAQLIETDSRRRISLAKLGVESDTYFLAERRDDGSILLVPAEVRPKVMEIIERVVPDWRTGAAMVEEVDESPAWSTIRAEVASNGSSTED